MSCTHPLKGFPTAVDPRSGKMQYKIVSYDTDNIQRGKSDSPWLPSEWKAMQYPVLQNNMVQMSNKYIDVPCGKCIECRLAYSREWANRCMMELQGHDEAWFVTLTYDPDHVPISYFPDPKTGEAVPIMTLRKRDLQLFFKRLRKHFPDGQIRFYGSGEYGSSTQRPHYHAIIYGLHLDDLCVHKYNELGQPVFVSDWLQRVWGLGFVTVGEVTWNSCAYVARYIMKKHKGKDADFYEKFNLTPEFTQMSRKPGIARDFYEAHKNEMYTYDAINLSLADGGKKIRPAKYFDRLYDIEEPEIMENLKKNRRKSAELHEKAVLSKTTLTKQEYNAIMERQKQNSIRRLLRNEI